MRDPVADDQRDEEKPLDPASLEIQQKLRRLLLRSSLVMGVGFLAVIAVIVYKVASGKSNDGFEHIAATVALEKNEKILDIEVMNGKLAVLVDQNGAQSLVYIDPVTGKKLGKTVFLAR